jgi:transcriptional regulator with XRE-family HTH domain
VPAGYPGLVDGRVRQTLKHLGTNVRTLRLDRGLTQAAFAERVGIEPRSVQRLEAGATCSITTVVAVAYAFDVPVASLFMEAIALPKRRVGRPRKI